MTEPIPVDAADFFKFIGGSELAVTLVSVHPVHAFNGALCQHLAREHEGITFGTVDLSGLIVSGSPVLRFLHQGLRGCGAPCAFGVLPGYYLFRAGEMLAWNAGLPAFADLEAIARSAVLGAIVSGLTRDAAFVGRALHVAAEQVAAHRVAVLFRHAVAGEGANRRAPRDAGPPPIDQLYWAYHVLGVLPTATDREVQDAWRRRRIETHPDHAVKDPVEFERRSRISREINRARDVIVDHRSGGPRRAAYAEAS